MPATAGQLAAIRAWCGSAPSNGDLTTRLERLGDTNAVALEVLRERRADLLRDPLTTNLVGDYSESLVENIKHLNEDIARLDDLVRQAGSDDGATSVTLGQLTRPDRARM